MRKLVVLLLSGLLTLGLWAGVAIAAEVDQDQPEQITMEDAVNRALIYSKVLKKADLEIKRSDSAHEDAEDKVSYDPTGIAPYDPALEAAYTNALLTNIQYKMSKRSKTVTQDKVVLDTCNKYWAVQRAKNTLALKELALNKASADYLKAKAFYDVGMTAVSDLLGAQTNLEQAKSDLTQAANNLNDTYAGFNQLIGMNVEERPSLVDEITFTPMEKVNNLQSEVNRIIENSPTVWQAEQLVNLKKNIRYLADNWDVSQAEMEQSEIDAENIKDVIELASINLYHNIISMEEAYPAALKAYELAAETQRKTKLMYAVGMATQNDLRASELQLATTQTALSNLTTQHAYLKLAFAKPWAFLSAAN